MADKDLSALLAELGGDNPQNRAIAEGLQKQGIGSTKDIGVQRVLIPRHMEGTDEGAYTVDDSYENKYFNKKDNSEINPTRLGVYQVDKNGKAQGDIFFHLNADDKGNVSFAPQWSPRAHGFLRDNAVGQAIMSIGKIIPATSPFFLAASAADAAAHGNYGAAIANLVPMGLQQLASGTDVLTQLAGPDFNPTAITPGGQIAEALGVPVQVADQVGKAATSAVKAGLSGKDAGEALLKSGIGSLVGSGMDYLKGVGSDILKDVKGGISDLMSPDTSDAASVGQTGLPSGYTPNEDGTSAPAAGFGRDESGNLLQDTRADENGLGGDLAVDTRADENGLGNDLAVDTRADENGIGSLNPAGTDNYSLDGGAGKDYVSPPSDGDTDGTMVDDGGTSTVGEGGTGYTEPIDTTQPLQLPPGAGPDEPEPEEPYLLNPDEKLVALPAPPVEPEEPPAETKEPSNDVDDTGLLPKVPAIFPPKPKTPVLKPVTVTGGGGNDSITGGGRNDTITGGSGNDGLTSLVDTLIGGTVVGKAVSDSNKTDGTTTADPLKGKYNFSWNQQETKAPEKGIAYGQRYFGPHWSQQTAAQNAAKDAVLSKDEPMTNPIVEQHADGGLMSLDRSVVNPNFQPTVNDNGIQASELTSQAIQHLRRGGHIVDHKLHKEVSYLASKGEPVHHIVGFMNHRKRMAEGGITSHSLGSYSDGGHLLKGPGDGMSDDIPATIADKQPARLANEEFVIPADVVSHLGNGSSESGAKVLYEMMAKIRKARTGNPKQGKQIDPHKLMPKV